MMRLLSVLSGKCKQQLCPVHTSWMNMQVGQIRDTANSADETIGLFLSERCSKLADDDAMTVNDLRRQLRRFRKDTSSMMGKMRSPLIASPMTKIITSSRRCILPASKEKLIGMEDVYSNIGRLLKGKSSDLQVISLLGIGGSGKTTLARKIYNRHSTLDVFQICGWVTVSRDYSVRDILLSLAKSLQPFLKEPKQQTQSAENYLHENLKGRRFLIVLDDVWSEEALDFLIRVFPDDGSRSRILVTTRLEKVAIEANPEASMRVTMRSLSYDESRTLLKHKAFKQELFPCEFDHYAHMIADRCKGVPIVIVLLAGILSALGKSIYKWKSFVDTFIRSDTCGKSVDEVVVSILSLSYSHLHSRLRSCLLHMGHFPEDYEINVSKLTKLWLAQGFVVRQSASSSQSPKCFGLPRSFEEEECLNELIDRNLVTVLKIKSDGGIKSCSLHDMVRDFCLKKAQEEGFFCHVKDNADQDHARNRMMIAYDLDNYKRICDSGNDNAHTIMCFGHGHNQLISVRRFRLLKTLDIVNVGHKSFPVEVLELNLLELLALSHVPELPPSIRKLRYLETLIIHPRDASSAFMPFPYIVCLPPEIWRMPRLRHLIAFCWGTVPNPHGASLYNLQTLSAVMNLDFSEQTLRRVPNIKKLGFFYFGVGHATHSLTSLRSLRCLEKLKVWVLMPFSSPQNLELVYPTTLKKLNLRGIQLSSREMRIIGQLPYLQVLKLRQNDFEGDEWRVSSKEFLTLEHLLLEELMLK